VLGKMYDELRVAAADAAEPKAPAKGSAAAAKRKGK
jgi:hypothetical protein